MINTHVVEVAAIMEKVSSWTSLDFLANEMLESCRGFSKYRL